MVASGSDDLTPGMPSGEGVRIIGAEEASVAVSSGRVVSKLPISEEGDVVADLRDGIDDEDEYEIAQPQMQHWTEPPTGEIPIALVNEDDGADVNQDAWSQLGAPVWHDEKDDWGSDDIADVAVLADADMKIGALDTDRSEESDLFTFEFEDDPYIDKTPSRPNTPSVRIVQPEPQPLFETEPEPVGVGAATNAATKSRATAVHNALEESEDDFEAGPNSEGLEDQVDPDIFEPPSKKRTPSSRRGSTSSATPSRRGNGPATGGQPLVPAQRDMGAAVLTGAVLLVATFVAFIIGPLPTFILALVAVMACAVELFDSLRKAGHHPITLIGLVATAGLMIGAYASAGVADGQRVIPLVLVLTLATCLGWHMVVPTRQSIVSSAGVTLLGVVWIGVFGSFAALMLNAPDKNGVNYLLMTLLGVVAYDIGGFFVGSRFGQRQLAPTVSPNKTVEGLIGGMLATVVVCTLVGSKLGPFNDHSWSGLKIGLVLALAAPLGDLLQSLVKRDLGIKDMGNLLPGHGGVFDRTDALLFCMPVTFYAVSAFNIF